MYVVSGCPRSGTSLMMDLCRVALGEDRIMGKKFPQEDRITYTNKRPDESKHEYDRRMYIYNKRVDHKEIINDIDKSKDMNPNGFWEMKYTVKGVYFRFNDLDNLNKIKEEKHGEKSICKIVSQGLAQSDPQYIDKIVYMVRHPRAVAKSQERLKTNIPDEDSIKKHSPDMYIRVTIQAARWILRFSDVPILHVHFDDLIETPSVVLNDVQAFLGDGDFQKAAKQIEPKLRRSQSEDVENDLWEDAEYVYTKFCEKNYQAIIDYTKNPERNINKVNKRIYCTRLNETVNPAICNSCHTNTFTRKNFKRRSERKGIDWQNEPCIFECDKISIEESSNKNHWLIDECKHADIQEELYNTKLPCKGRKVICDNPNCPITVWYSRGCNPDKCKFYESAK